MRTLQIPDRHSTRDAGQSENPCYICGKNILKGREKWGVHPIDGGSVALHPADEDAYQTDGGDLGLHPVGSECRKLLGEFAIPWKQD